MKMMNTLGLIFSLLGSSCLLYDIICRDILDEQYKNVEGLLSKTNRAKCDYKWKYIYQPILYVILGPTTLSEAERFEYEMKTRRGVAGIAFIFLMTGCILQALSYK